MIRLRPHHISAIALSYFRNFSDHEWLYRDYGDLFRHFVGMINAQVIYDYPAQILVVRGLDDFCQNPLAICPLKEEICETEFNFRDNWCQALYGLVIGRVYLATEILTIIKDFKTRTGSECPEEWLCKNFLEPKQKLLGRLAI